MPKAEDVAKLLAKHTKLMETLAGEEIGGFALVIPPGDGAVVEVVLLDGTVGDEVAFYTLVSTKLGNSKGSPPFGGGVNIPRR